VTKSARELSVTFDGGPLGQGTSFRAPETVIEVWEVDEVPHALDAMQQAKDAGKWLAGMASYELGYALISKIENRMPRERSAPLMQFGVFDAPDHSLSAMDVDQPNSDVSFDLSEFTPEWDFETYAEAFDRLRSYLESGDIYQANLTFPLTAHLQGCPYSLYAALKQAQPVPYGALVDLGETMLLSRSPELFFSLSKSPEDAHLKRMLETSEKNQAENLMITDLLRNDIGRIAQIGSVHVPKLFAVETYATVHQMTSDVVAQVQPNITLTDVFEALFPCGSITGAPKIRAMEILSDLEPSARNAVAESFTIAPLRANTEKRF